MRDLVRTSPRPVFGLITLALAAGLLAGCLALACAAQIWLPIGAAPFGYEVIVCAETTPGRIVIEYNNPILSQRLLRPSLIPPCALAPWLPVLPQSGLWRFPP